MLGQTNLQKLINPIAKLALLRLIKADQVEVDIKTNFKKISQGEIDSIQIKIAGMLTRNSLKVKTTQLQIGGVTVNTKSAVRGKIELVRPSEGHLELIISQENLTNQLNYKLHQNLLLKLVEKDQIQFEIPLTNQSVICLVAIPSLDKTRKTLILDQVSPENSSPLPLKFINSLFSSFSNLVNLKDWETAETRLTLNRFYIQAGQLHLIADALIDNFPSG